MNLLYSIVVFIVWLQKVVDEFYVGEEEGINVIGLLFVKIDQLWFFDEVFRDVVVVCYVQGCLKFGGFDEGVLFVLIVVFWLQDEEMIVCFVQVFGVDI